MLSFARHACSFYVGSWNMSGFLNDQKPVRTLREILKQMRTAYCGNIGFEVRRAASSARCAFRCLVPALYSSCCVHRRNARG